MPQWVINLMLPYVMPTILAMLTPILSEYIKKMYEYLLGHLSPPVMMALATGVAAAVNQASEWLAEFRRYIEDEGVGQVPEVFDGGAPQRPGGCIAQAWSVAELLRCLLEDIRVVSKSG